MNSSDFKQGINPNFVKLLRACGGCLGSEKR